MKKYFLILIGIFVCLVCVDGKKADAYSVELQKDGIYAETLPKPVVDNSVVLFKKYVDKARKYYKKYKKNNAYTLLSNVPEEYRIFIPIVKDIEPSDKIVIKTPFYIYDPTDAAGNTSYEYYFVAEKNGKKMCIFCITISTDNKKIYFYYDNVIDKYSKFNDKMMEEGAIIYEIDGVIYEQTKNKKIVVLDQSDHSGATEMIGDIDTNLEKMIEKFKNKSFDDKKEEIFECLAGVKEEKVVKKSEENLKLDLKDEYVGDESIENNSSKKGIYIGIAAAIAAIIGAGVMVKKYRIR
ncbi:unknown [Clostridium sp. CAG:253]|nr:unknown [Clostridium sp. CAG:253]